MNTTTEMFLMAFGFPIIVVLGIVLFAYILKWVTPTLEKFSKKRAAAESAEEEEFRAIFGEEWGGSVNGWGTTTPRQEADINNSFLLVERFLSWLNLEKHPIRIILVVAIIIITALSIVFFSAPEFFLELFGNHGEKIIIPQ